VLYSIDGNRKTKIGETEVIADSLDPKWVKAIEVDFYFEAQQQFRVELYDADDPIKLHDLSQHDFIGGYDFTLSKVVSAKN
jgi:hypothetical protein